MYTKKSKGPSIQPCGIPAKMGDQVKDWPLRTTFWNSPETPTVSSFYNNPYAHTLLQMMDFDQNMYRCCEQLTVVDFH